MRRQYPGYISFARFLTVFAFCLLYLSGICQAQATTPEQEQVISLFQQAEIYNSQQNYLESVKLYQEAVRLAEKAFGKQDPNYISLVTNLAGVYRKSGSYGNAEKFYKQALESWEQTVGPDHPNVASTLNLLAVVYHSQGKFIQAVPLLQRSLAIRKRVLGASHPDVAAILNNLAAVYSSLGDYRNAGILYQEALAIQEQVYGMDNPNVAITLDNFAGVLRSQGRLEEGIALSGKALATKEKLYGPEHPDVATSLDTLGNFYFDMKDFDRTEELCKRSLQIREKALGPGHPETATSLNNLAALYEARTNYSEAESLLKRAVSIYEESLGSGHPSYASALHNLASLYVSMNYFSEAEGLLLETVALRINIYGESHDAVADTMNNLAGLYMDTGEYGKARQAYEEVLAIREKMFGTEHSDVAAAMNNIAGIYSYLGDYDHALDLYSKALAIRERTLGENHLDVAEACNNLASLYQSMGDYRQSLSLYQKSLAIVENTQNRDNQLTGKILINTAELYLETGDHATALPLYEKGVAILENNVGPDHLDVATAYNNLAACYLAASDYDRAKTAYRKALAIREGKLPADHPSFSANLISLSAVCAAQGEGKEAFSYMQRGIEIDRNLIDHAMGFSSDRQKMLFLSQKQWHLYGLFTLVNEFFPDDTASRKYLFDIWAQRKGIILEAQKRFQEALVYSDNPEAVKMIQSLARIRSELSRLAFVGTGKTDPSLTRQKIEELRREKEALEEGLSQVSQEYAAHRKITRADSEAIADSLPPGSVLVDFARIAPVNFRAGGEDKEQWAPERYIVFMLHAGQGDNIDIIDLGNARTIDDTVAELKKNISGSDDSRKDLFVQPAQKLYSLVFERIEKKLGQVTDLYISPDGNLNLIPFEVMQKSNGIFLIEDYTFNYLATSRDLLDVGSGNTQKGKSLIIGNPDFDLEVKEKDTLLRELGITGTEERGSRVPADVRGIYFSRLPGTEEEAKAISDILGSSNVDLYMGKEALAELVAQKKSPRFLHLATHGFFLSSPEMKKLINPSLWSSFEQTAGTLPDDHFEDPLLRSGLAFAGANSSLQNTITGKNDGILTAEEILGLDLRGTEMVVLSACQTGLGEVMTGEGVFGLRRAFLQAGAKSLVMSMWEVPDRETKELMIEFYGNSVIKGMSRTEALKQAALQQKKIAEERHGTSNPFYWGAFVSMGTL